MKADLKKHTQKNKNKNWDYGVIKFVRTLIPSVALPVLFKTQVFKCASLMAKLGYASTLELHKQAISKLYGAMECSNLQSDVKNKIAVNNN